MDVVGVVGVANPGKLLEDILNKINSKIAIYLEVRLLGMEGKDI